MFIYFSLKPSQIQTTSTDQTPETVLDLVDSLCKSPTIRHGNWTDASVFYIDQTLVKGYATIRIVNPEVETVVSYSLNGGTTNVIVLVVA